MLHPRQILAALLAACLALAGCQTAKPPPGPVNAGDFFDLRPPGVKAAAADAANDAEQAARADTGASLPRGAGLAMPSRQGAAPPSGRPRPYSIASDMVKDLADPDLKEEVSLFFDAPKEIQTVVEMFGKILDFQYWIDPGVTGSVSLKISSKQMSRKELWQLLEDILWMNGAYLSRKEGFIHVLPFKSMPQDKRLLVVHDPHPNVAVELLAFRYLPAASVVALIQPFLSQGATIQPVPNLNAILLVEQPGNLPKIHELIQRLDVLGETQWPMMSLQVHNVDADILVEELKLILPTIGFPVSAAGAGGNTPGVKLTPIKRVQVLIVAAPSLEVLEEVSRWVTILDRESLSEQEQIFFYDVRYSKAEDLNAAIGTFFQVSSTGATKSNVSTTGEAPAFGAPSRSTTGTNTTTNTTTSTTTRPTTPTPTTATTTRTSSSRAPTEPGAHVSAFETPLSVFVDAKHNRLVVRTTSRAYAMLEALLRRLDSPPLQAVIQMSIAEIQLNEDTEYGFKFAAQNWLDSGKYEVKGRLDPDGKGTAATAGFNLLFRKGTRPEDAFGFITAIAGKSNTRVLFSPQILAISDQKAVINVGDSVPIVTSESNTGDSTNITRSIQYRDTGIILTVTPHITAKKLVSLEIKQEVSDAVSNSSSTIDSPTIQTRVVESALMVEDGSTVLLGGLISSRKVYKDSGFPILKDMPGVGKLFGTTSNEDKRQELLLLISVNVIDMSSDLQGLINRYQKAVRAISEEQVATDAAAGKAPTWETTVRDTPTTSPAANQPE